MRQVMGIVDPETNIFYPFIGGGDGEGDEMVLEGEEGDGNGGGDESGQQQPRTVPYDRFVKVNQEAKKAKELQALVDQYRSFGNPEDLKLLKTQHAEMLKGSSFTPSERDKMRKELLETLPELNQFKSFVEAQGRSFIDAGTNRVNKYVGEIGMEANEERNHFIQELLSGCIAATGPDGKPKRPDFIRRFAANDLTVLDDAWKIVKKELWGNNTRKPSSNAADVARLKKPAAPGNNRIPDKQNDKPLNERDQLDQDGEKAFALLESMGSGD